MVYELIIALPLAGFLIAGLFGKDLGDRACEVITSAFMVLAACLSWLVFFMLAIKNGHSVYIHILPWLTIGDFSFDWALRIDSLTAVMLIVVNTVSSLVHIYSIGYMHHDKSRTRFFAYLSLFTFMMLMLVTSNNLVQMFFGWEGVGLASYLLIGFWYEKHSANKAAIKAFVTNRVGDFAFLLGIFSIFMIFNALNFDTIFVKLASHNFVQNWQFLGFNFAANGIISVICLLLFIGAMGKSAQFLLHVWLPDAMEGPTPVSALIHAATMVTAGVFMVARFSPLFEQAPLISIFIVIIGSMTAFFAATVALVQNDIKRVIAYSTCSQLGYMFTALGVGAYSAGVFHLFTHAFFKALLFLGAGSVIHAVSDEQDMRKMGGLYKYIPVTYVTMLIGTLALTGFGVPETLIGTAGFFSKDAIIEAAYASSNIASMLAFWLLVIAALFTSFYSWRVVFMTFHGKPRATTDVMHHVHESGSVMLIPLLVLSLGALFGGIVFKDYFIGEFYNAFWKGALFTNSSNHVLHAMHHVDFWVKSAAFIAMLIGFFTAFIFYIIAPNLPKKLAFRFPKIYDFLLNKWYIDELYQVIFVNPAFRLGNLFWKSGDINFIDRFGPNGIASKVLDITNKAVRLQSGFIYHYAFMIIIGMAALLTLMMVGSFF
ncbi:NADH-quinone oxidoreductase subunit L [Bartonella sp. TP]|uniref:NADH-quinone oxidoreductase subunit L n=1 Tax=Bartonella sp. TP TaxID=3057550 RepID=UPI0025B06998|nr:NADH-quinone oxidoreductase subunit L [Bartonella sp. TP]MDN5248907.1 NADH-quinone oxidoreductase subunit L [Alphaproteobacteria bacterium]WJW79936.1 NADH-quinone oxidoreductase subunit L [Bartonella sp. TP]